MYCIACKNERTKRTEDVANKHGAILCRNPSIFSNR